MKRHSQGPRPTPFQRELLACIECGLPLVSAPYAEVARRLGVDEAIVIDELRKLVDGGVIKRMGIVVRHQELGYRANAMVVWDVPDERVDDCGQRLAALPFVTLSYRRPRRLPRWPYNLYCMIHGKSRGEVVSQIALANQRAGLAGLPRAVLFSRRRFKQRGARYHDGPPPSGREAAA